MNIPPRYVTIEDNVTLVRDTFSMGVINTNNSALEEYKRRHKLALNKIAEERRKDAELNNLRKELDELKFVVNKILAKEQ